MTLVNVLYDKNDKDQYEIIHDLFCKFTLGINKHTSAHAARFELGRFPMYIKIFISCIKYWYRMEKSLNNNMFLMCAYNVCKRENQSWFKGLSYLLNSIGCGNLLHTNMSIKKIIKIVKLRLQDQYLQIWKNKCSEDSNLSVLDSLKTELSISNILVTETNLKNRSNLIKFRQGTLVKKFGTDNIVCPFCKSCLNCSTSYHILHDCIKVKDLSLNLLLFLKTNVRNFNFKSKNEQLLFILKCEGNNTVTNRIVKFINLLFERLSSVG